MLELSGDLLVDLAHSGARQGQGLFETLHLHRGKPRRLALHLERLASGCAYLGLDAPPDAARVEAFLGVHLPGEARNSGVLRLVAVDGRLFLWIEPLPVVPSGPVRLGLSQRATRFSRNPLNRFKTLAYLENALLAREAEGRGCFDVLAPNEYGRLSDGGRTTVFTIQRGRMLTPSGEDGPLPGIARRVLLEDGLAEEAPLRWEDLAGAEAVFLANSLRGVIPVGHLDGLGPCLLDHPLVAKAARRLEEE